MSLILVIYNVSLDFIFDIALSAMAVIDKEGFTPGFAEIIEPSTTNIFLYPKTLLFLSITPFVISSPITAPPKICAVEGIPKSVSPANEVAFPFAFFAYNFVNAIDSGIKGDGFCPLLTVDF